MNWFPFSPYLDFAYRLAQMARQRRLDESVVIAASRLIPAPTRLLLGFRIFTDGPFPHGAGRGSPAYALSPRGHSPVESPGTGRLLTDPPPLIPDVHQRCQRRWHRRRTPTTKKWVEASIYDESQVVQYRYQWRKLVESRKVNGFF